MLNYLFSTEDAKKSVDELFTTSHEIPTQPLTPTSKDGEPEVIDGEPGVIDGEPEVIGGEPEVIDLTQSDIQDDVSTEVSEEIVETREEVVEENQPEPEATDGAVGGDVEAASMAHDENGNNSESTTPDDEGKGVSENDDKKRKGREGSPR